MHILIVSATADEITPLLQTLRKSWIEAEPFSFSLGSNRIDILIPGVGCTPVAFALGQYFALESPALAIQAGISGSFSSEYPPGTVVHVVSERFADLGAETQTGEFLDLHQLELHRHDQFPYHNGKLINPQASTADFLPRVEGITVNKVHGRLESIEKVRARYNPDVESMEGAAFFYACLVKEVPFLSIRSISNMVEARNRENWNIPLAIEELNANIEQILNLLLD